MSSDVTQLKTTLISNGSEFLPCLLELINGNIWKPESQKSLSDLITNLLSNGKTRPIGLELLQASISYCSRDVLAQTAFQWSSYCVVQHMEDPEKGLKLLTLSKIIENTSNIEVFNKKFSGEYLGLTLKACLVYKGKEERVAGLKCLTQCMKRYQAWFGNHKQKIESYLIDCLESPSQSVGEAAAVAFVSFLETGGAGASGINYINNFSHEFKRICASIQMLYDCFFDGFCSNSFGEVFQFSQSNSVDAIANKLLNCLVLLKTIIVKQFSVEKRIIPKLIIDVIYRGLSSHFCFPERFVLDRSSNKCLVLRKIQLCLFSLIRAVIKWEYSSLMPFSAVIESTLLKTLIRTHNCNCFVLDTTYKTAAYKTLVSWLMLSKVINELHFQEKLIPVILKDICPPKKTVVLNTDPKKQIQADGNNTSSMSTVVLENSCICALETLKCVLTTSFSVDPNAIKQVLVFVVKTLSDIQGGILTVPYNNPNCQLKLYEALVSFFKTENLTILPSLHFTINILTVGSNNRNWKISQVSKEGLEFLEKISHPVCPTLYISDFQTPIEQMDQTEEIEGLQNCDHEIKEKVKIISDIVINVQNEVRQEEENPKQVEDSEMQSITDEREEACEVIDIEDSEKEDCEMIFETPTPVEKKTEDTVEVNEKIKVVEENGVDDMFSSFQDVVQEQ